MLSHQPVCSTTVKGNGNNMVLVKSKGMNKWQSVELFQKQLFGAVGELSPPYQK